MSTAMASHETIRVDRSALNAPTSNSTIAPTARTTSGSAGKMTGSEVSGIGRGLMQARFTRAVGGRGVVGGVYLLDYVIDRGLHRAQKRIRIDAHPYDQDQQRSEHHLLSQAQVQHATQIGAREGAENHPPIHVEHVHWAEE